MKAELHPVVAAMPADAETSIEAVGKYIAEREHDPVQRVKALHDWAADRIAYNAPSLKLPRIPHEDGDAESVFRRRTGVCAGYARLLEELGKVTGDEIVYVVGDARSYREPMKGEPHAWNAAKINGRYYLIDATWDAGGVNSDRFEKRYSTDYLFTPAETFSLTHYPDERAWQLAEPPIEREEFFRRPALRPNFFAEGLSLKSPDRAQVAAGAFLDVLLDNPRGRFVMISYEPTYGGHQTDCRGDRRGRGVRCEFSSTGTYDVHIFLGQEEYGRYSHAGSVQVNARL
ncbi:MAG: hypothetical protein IPG50_33675 [Myxococcales bacterium]|nr:hypothetical protein [Myxococcales bacterium]